MEIRSSPHHQKIWGFSKCHQCLEGESSLRLQPQRLDNIFAPLIFPFSFLNGFFF
ncbi:hypothetical protein MANES_01G162750v8 [Manihot esculenta]|uniref:Uncharacterized protein n=1 Tax=Manihot esculenta TaxID=3983 RepID=A0ACB7IIA9_MANES|nr:hypothetical protein MANES_01G162750v8 [Manihot esculenta]